MGQQGIPLDHQRAEQESLRPHNATTNREGYREYKSRSCICEKCLSRSQCTESQNCTKTVTRHVWQDYVEMAEDVRHTLKYKELYQRRKETIERVFADAKVKYGMRYTLYKGLTQVTNWVKLKFAAINLKKLAMLIAMRKPSYRARPFGTAKQTESPSLLPQ
ncbi:transposase [Faecalispora sporosphaeroides]|uniref:transposase n=1 Tax=Faecalispora sporosphaeroides TaxID=1549 RepID=UPI0015A6B2B6|nr:transposase [Faecalispora sporosphaeroides]